MKKNVKSSEEVTIELSKKRPGRHVVWENMSDSALRAAYKYRRSRNRVIELGLHAELVRRFPSYDAATQTFTGIHTKKGGGRPKTVRTLADGQTVKNPKSYKKPLKELASSSLRQMYYQLRREGQEIPDDMNAELARRFPAYNKKTRSFVRLGRGERIATAADIAEMRGKQPAQASVTEKPAPKVPAPVTAQTDNVLRVTVKPVQTSADQIYSDVFVNGHRILRNHINTEVCTFADGAILGVRGIVTDMTYYPSRPVWMLYSTDLNPHRWARQETWNSYALHIRNVREEPEFSRVRVDLSDHSIILQDIAREKRRAAGRVFKIMDEKTK